MEITGADLNAGSFGVASGFDVVLEDVIPDCVCRRSWKEPFKPDTRRTL